MVGGTFRRTAARTYYHVVFTLPHVLAPLALQNKALVYGLLFRSAAETLLEIAADPKHLGAKIVKLRTNAGDRLPGFVDASQILADPSIFHATQAQAEGGFKSIADLYSEAGLDGLWEGENAEIAGMERILEHWRDLDYREPTLKIICPHDTLDSPPNSRKRFGLFES